MRQITTETCFNAIRIFVIFYKLTSAYWFEDFLHVMLLHAAFCQSQSDMPTSLFVLRSAFSTVLLVRQHKHEFIVLICKIEYHDHIALFAPVRVE